MNPYPERALRPEKMPPLRRKYVCEVPVPNGTTVGELIDLLADELPEVPMDALVTLGRSTPESELNLRILWEA